MRYPYRSNYIDSRQYVETSNPDRSERCMRKDLRPSELGTLLDITEKTYENLFHCCFPPATSSRSVNLDALAVDSDM